MTVDAFCSHAHLVGHLAPIFCALTPEERGTFYVTERAHVTYAERFGIVATIGTPREPIRVDPTYAARYGIALHDQPTGDHPTLIASHHDLTQVAASRPIIYVEHGAGQQYVDKPQHPSYSGGLGRERVALFLTLNHTTAARERAVYPDTPVAVIGSPRMEALRECARWHMRLARDGAHLPVVAYAPHWNCDLNPETRWAFPEWRAQLSTLARSGAVTMLGHGHPRVFPHLVQWYESLGVEAVRDFEDVVVRADLLITDNSSAGPEFAAATDRPVLWLNASGYRKDVEHGGRFWDWIGKQVCADVGMSLADGVLIALQDHPDARTSRARMVASVYPVLPGTAAGCAVEAIRREELA